MSLIRKQPTEAMVAANRANSLKSCGPVTDPGKMNARLNALQHGVRAQASGSCIPELGEREEELKSLRIKLHLSLQPNDGFEEMLVQEMVENRWRRRRLLRAEGGILAAQRLSFAIDYGRKLAGDGRSAAEVGGASVAARFGLVALPDSPAKFNLILQTLRAAEEAVEREGFSDTGLRYLEAVYGPDPGLAGAALLARYRQQLQDGPAVRAEVINPAEPVAEVSPDNAPPGRSAQSDFEDSLAAEIACFEKLLELHEKGEEELAQARSEAQNSLSEPDARRILHYETTLDRQFERLVKQLQDHRQTRREERAARDALLAPGADALSRERIGPLDSRLPRSDRYGHWPGRAGREAAARRGAARG